jgi:hypothetical protein
MCTGQYDRTWAVIRVVNVDDLRVRILNVRYREANGLRRLRRSDEVGNRNGKCNRHLESDRRWSVVSLGWGLSRHHMAHRSDERDRLNLQRPDVCEATHLQRGPRNRNHLTVRSRGYGTTWQEGAMGRVI